MNNRWIYKGSVTTSPCAKEVYWNVLRTIYPIKDKHLQQFNTQLAKGDEGTNTNGNLREIQELNT